MTDLDRTISPTVHPSPAPYDEDAHALGSLEGRVEIVDAICCHLRDSDRDSIAGEIYARFFPSTEDETSRSAKRAKRSDDVESLLRQMETWSGEGMCPFCLGDATSIDGHGQTWDDNAKGYTPCIVAKLRLALDLPLPRE